MPHKSLDIHAALIRTNAFLADYDPEVVTGATDLLDVARAIDAGGSTTVENAVGRLHPVVRSGLLGALQAAAADARPVFVSWRPGTMQRLEVTPPAASGVPLHVLVESRYDEDGLGPPSTT